VVLLDAYGLIALLADEPASDDVADLIGAHEAAMTAVNLAEAVDVIQRRYDISPPALESALDDLFADAVALVTIGDFEARRAGMLRAQHYHSRSRRISLADCFLLAAAGESDSVATADPHVVEVADLERIDVVRLPDSAGRRS
jgi:PIN domain nuclease of toxin-antitoxin system